MYRKNKHDIIKYILRKHLKIVDNLLLSSRLFVLNTILDWVLSSTKNPKIIESYVADLEKYVSGEAMPDWMRFLFEHKKERRDKNDNEEIKERQKTRS